MVVKGVPTPQERAPLLTLSPYYLMLFWTQVRRVEGGCWLWEGHVSPKGYGEFQVEGRHWRAHRLAYELLVGPIAEGLTLDHLCRVRHCVKPLHLEPTTAGENVLRGEGRTAVFAQRDACSRGHAYTPDNTYVTRQGHRQCRACHRLRRRRALASAATKVSGE